jgi:adhesin transport system outer membrane protein
MDPPRLPGERGFRWMTNGFHRRSLGCAAARVSLPLLLACMPAAIDAAGLAAFTEQVRVSLPVQPEVVARHEAFRAQLSAFAASRAGARPRLDLTGSVGVERSRYLSSGGTGDPETGSSRRATLLGRQLLYDGGEIDAETERQGHLANVLLFELRATEDTVLLESARAWVDVLRQRALVAVAAEVVESHERLVALVGVRVGSGVARPVDQEQAAARLASARLSREAEEAALAEALARWRRLSAAPIPLGGAGFEVPSGWMPGTEADALAEAMANAPSALATLCAVSALGAEVRVRRAAYAPRVALEARHDLAAQTPFFRDAAATSLLVTLSLNLFAGFGDTNREAETERRLEAARQTHRDALLALRQSVATGWAETSRNARALSAAIDYAASIRRARDLYLAQYELAQRSLLDLLNAESELAQARRLETNTRADRVVSQLRLLASLGRLPERMGVARLPALPPVPVGEPVPLPLAGAAPVTAVMKQGSAGPVTGSSLRIEEGEVRYATRRSAAAERVEALIGTDIPEAVRRGLLGWVAAIEAGRPRDLSAWHVGSPDPQWLAGERMAVVSIERIDPVGAAERSVQLSIRVLESGGAALRCLTGTQRWRSGPGAAAAIVERERVLAVPIERCTSATQGTGRR